MTIKLVDEGQQIKLSIEDTGVGISSDELPRIFQRFYRCDWSRSESTVGPPPFPVDFPPLFGGCDFRGLGSLTVLAIL